jgi:hypothetical protein
LIDGNKISLTNDTSYLPIRRRTQQHTGAVQVRLELDEEQHRQQRNQKCIDQYSAGLPPESPSLQQQFVPEARLVETLARNSDRLRGQ